MSIQLLSIALLVGMFVIATIQPINMGALAFACAFLRRLADHRDESQRHFRRLSKRPVPDAGRHHLSVRHRPDQRHDRLARRRRRQAGARTCRPGFPWVMFLVAAIITGFGALGPAAVAILAPVALGFAVPVPHQPGHDGTDGDPRRAGRRLFADQHLWRHHQPDRREGRPAFRADDRCSSPASSSTWRSPCSSSSFFGGDKSDAQGASVIRPPAGPSSRRRVGVDQGSWRHAGHADQPSCLRDSERNR